VYPPWRVGHGYDIHRLVDAAGAELALAGCRLPVDCQAEAHSDGDVVLHALIDAALGAVGDQDIGACFPDSDPAYAGADSGALLAAAWRRPSLAGRPLLQLDVTVIAQRPRLGPYRDQLRASLARLTGLPPDRIGWKARTKEQCDATGAGRAIEAHVLVVLGESG